jgi:large subunit ribosomal protein L31
VIDRFCHLEAHSEGVLVKIMKDGIHPKYMACKVTCGCGSSFDTRATVAELKVEICGACHPFYTGKQKFVDTAGRVEKFRQRYAKASGDKATS